MKHGTLEQCIYQVSLAILCWSLYSCGYIRLDYCTTVISIQSHVGWCSMVHYSAHNLHMLTEDMANALSCSFVCALPWHSHTAAMGNCNRLHLYHFATRHRAVRNGTELNPPQYDVSLISPVVAQLNMWTLGITQ